MNGRWAAEAVTPAVCIRGGAHLALHVAAGFSVISSVQHRSHTNKSIRQLPRW